MKSIRIAFFLMTTCGALSHAAPVMGSVSFDSTPLFGSVAGPFSLAFQLGGGSELGNNSAVLTNFVFGGGAASSGPILIGGASGSLTTGITITDSGASNIFIEGITVGTIIGFDLFLTSNVDVGGTADDFIWSILDNTLSPIPTSSSSVLEPVLSITINSTNPTVETFNHIFLDDPPAGLVLPFDAPVFTAATSAVPEPSTFLLSSLGFAGLLLGLRKKSRSAR